MELEFKTTLKESQDITLMGFSENIDGDFDYINDIDININWRAIIYMKDYGITDNFPIIDALSFTMTYQLLEDEEMDKISDEEKDYKFQLGPLDFLTAPLGISEKRERNNLPYEDKKWVIENTYSNREENETHLFITGVVIDFFTKEITIEF